MFDWLKFWMIIIGYFCILTYIQLNCEKTYVGYYSKYSKSKLFPTLSMCLSMNVTKRQYPLINDCKNYLNTTNPYVKLVCFVSNLDIDDLIPNKIIQYARSINVHDMFDLKLSKFKLKKSKIYINNFHLCISYDIFNDNQIDLNRDDRKKIINLNDSKFLDYNEQFRSIKMEHLDYLVDGTWSHEISLKVIIFNKFKISSKLFIYPQNEFGYYFSLYKFNQYCSTKPFNQSICNSGQLIVSRTNYTKLPAPYKTDCRDYSKLNFNFTKNKLYSRVNCIGECRKSIFTDNTYLYTENDSEPLFRLQKNANYNESLCFNSCDKTDCDQNFYYVTTWKNLTDQSLIEIQFLRLQYDIITYAKISELTFLLQLTSYLCLILNNNLIAQILKLHSELIDKLIKFKLTKKYAKLIGTEFIRIRIYFIAFFLAFLITFMTLSDIYDDMIDDNRKINNYIAFANYPIYYTHLIVTICFPIGEILYDRDQFIDEYDDELNLSYEWNKIPDDLLKINNKLLEIYKIDELNIITKNYTELIDAQFHYSDLRTENLLKYNNSVSITFQPTYLLLDQEIEIINLTLYSKCFSFNITVTEYTIQRLFRMSTLRFKIKDNQFSHFLINDNNRLPNYDDCKLFTTCKLNRIEERIDGLRTDCKNYDEDEYYQDLGCSNRDECRDSCVKRKYALKYNKIPFHSIYRLNELIKDKDGNKIDHVETFTSEHHLDYRIMKANCNDEYNIHDCFNAKYVNIQSCTKNDFNFDIITIRLYMESIVELYRSKWSLSELFNQTTTILSVLFGFTASGFLIYILKSIRLIFKINFNSRRIKQVFKLLFFLIMLLNCGQIISRAIKTNPFPNTLYSAFEIIKLPKITTCIIYDYLSIQRKYKRLNINLTGHILDKETFEIKFENIYSRIDFYLENLTMIKLNVKELIRNQNFNYYKINFDKFYFQNYKCWNLFINLTYDTSNRRLFFIDDMIKLYLDDKAPINKMIYSLSPKTTINFNELNEIHPNCIHLISFETYSIKSTDYYKFLRNPGLIFMKGERIFDEENYLETVSNKLSLYNLTSVLYPIYEKDFNLTIDYLKVLNLYREFFQSKKKSFFNLNDPDYERFIFKSIKMYKHVNNFTLLIINPNFLYFKIDYTNLENPSSIILYLLNQISFWLDINYVDYPIVLINFFKGIFRMIKLLKLFKL